MASAIRIAVLANAAQAKRELGGVASTVEKSGGRIGRFARSAGKAVATGLAVATVAAGAFAVSAVKSASDAQQSYGASETVFGKYADKIIKHSDRAANRVGLSANDYRESANLIGALFKNQGVAADKLAGKTDRMVKTGADLAATYGGTTKEAVEALGSAFKGEFDPLERYGISIKQSTINAELAARGEDKLTGAALRAAQARATSALITKQAGGALGAFGRESNTLAGQQQRVSAGAENIKAKIGSALLPALTALFSTLNTNVLPAVAELADKYAPKLGRSLAGLATAAGPKLAAALQGLPDFVNSLKSSGGASTELGSLSANVGKLAGGARQAAGSLPSFNDAFKVSNVVLGFAADHIGLLTKLLPVLAFGYAGLKASQLAANVVQTLSLPTKIAEVVVNRQLVASNRALIASRTGVTGATVTNTAAENVGMLTRVRSLAGLVAQKVALVATSAATKAAAAAQWLLNSAMFANPIGLVILAIVALVAVFVIAWKKSATFRKIVIGSWNAIKASTVAIWNAVKKVVSTAVRFIVAYFRTQFAIAKAIITGVWNFVKGATTRVWNGIKTSVRLAVAGVIFIVRSIHRKVVGVFTGAGTWLLNAGKKLIGGLISGIGDKIGDAIQTVRDGLSKIRDMLPGSPIKAGPLTGWNRGGAGKRLIKMGLIDGIKAQVPALRRAMSQVAGEVDAFSASPASTLAMRADYGAQLTSSTREEQTFSLRLSAAQVNQLQRGREYHADIKAYREQAGR